MMAKAATLDAPTRYSSVRLIGRSLISHKPSNAGKSRLVCGVSCFTLTGSQHSLVRRFWRPFSNLIDFSRTRKNKSRSFAHLGARALQVPRPWCNLDGHGGHLAAAYCVVRVYIGHAHSPNPELKPETLQLSITAPNTANISALPLGLLIYLLTALSTFWILSLAASAATVNCSFPPQ